MTGLTGMIAKIQTSGGPLDFFAEGSFVGATIDVGDGNGPIPINSGINKNQVQTIANTDIIIVGSGLTRLRLGDGMRAFESSTENLISVKLGDQASNLTDADGMFEGQKNLTVFEIYEQSWSSKLTTIRFMFNECTSLTTLPMMDFDSAKLIDVFCSSIGATTLPAFHFPVATSADSAFLHTQVVDFPLMTFPVLTSATWMFANNRKMKTFPNIDLNLVSDFTFVFYGCDVLEKSELTKTKSAVTIESAWMNCPMLTDFAAIDSSNVVHATSAWYSCNSLVNFPVIDLSKCTEASKTWKHCRSMKHFPDLDLSKVTDFSEAWSGCHAMLDINHIDISSGVNFRQTFRDCTSLVHFDNNIPATAASLSAMFAYCYALKYVSNFHTSSVTNMESVFTNCMNLECIHEIDTTSATDTTNMFNGTHSLARPDATERAAIVAPGGLDWLNDEMCPLAPFFARITTDGGETKIWVNFGSTATTATATIDWRDGIGPVALVSGLNTGTAPAGEHVTITSEKSNELEHIQFGKNVASTSFISDPGHTRTLVTCTMGDQAAETLISTSQMFFNQAKLISLEIKEHFTANVTEAVDMFVGCAALETIPDMNFDKVINMTRFCSYSGVINLLSVSFPKVLNGHAAFSNTKIVDFPKLSFGSIQDMSYMFSGNKKLLFFPEIDFSTASNANYAWENCDKMISFKSHDFSSATFMKYAFSNCSSLESLPLLETDSMDYGGNIFSDCSKLKCIGGIDTRVSTDVGGMFDNTPALVAPNTIDQGLIASSGNGIKWVNSGPCPAVVWTMYLGDNSVAKCYLGDVEISNVLIG